MPTQQIPAKDIVKLMKTIALHVLEQKMKEPSGTWNQTNGAKQFWQKLKYVKIIYSMDNNTNDNNGPPTLVIPRLTEEYIRDGFKTLNWHSFYEPDTVLNFHYPDIVLFALLAHVKKPKHILDLGSFFGMLPFIVEEIFRSSGSNEQFNWTLVDTCLYTKEFAEAIKSNTPISARYLNQKHFNAWRQENVQPWKEVFFRKLGDYFVPPSNSFEFDIFWYRFALHYRIPKPPMTMFESIEEVKDKKFDLVHFDLTAGASELNKRMFEHVANHLLSDDGIIVFDDMRPQHPKMLLFFQYILSTSDFRPIAFSTGKIAMMRKKYKADFIFSVDNAGLRQINHVRDNYFSFAMAEGEETDWGNFLDLRTN
jgi:hypothetical protein